MLSTAGGRMTAGTDRDTSIGDPADTRVVASLPLLLVGAIFLGLSLTSHAMDYRLGPGQLGVWVLFLGMGAIVLTGGVAALVLRARSSGVPIETRRESRPPRAVETRRAPAPPDLDSSIVAAEPTAPPIDTSDVPAPTSYETAGWVPGTIAGSPAAPSSRTTLASEIDRVLERIPAAVHGSGRAETPGASTTAAPSPSTPDEETDAACATCHRPLPPRSTWRRCQNCGRSLCADCLTESVRQWGGGFCETCAAAVTGRSVQPAPT